MIHILRELGFDYSEKDDDVAEAVKELAQLKGINPDLLRVPEAAVMSLSVGITEALVSEFEARDVPWIYRARPLYVGRVGGADVGIIWASPAPL